MTTEQKEYLEEVVENYYGDLLDNGETPRASEWTDAYDCFCGCVGNDFDFDENEAIALTKKIWKNLRKQ